MRYPQVLPAEPWWHVKMVWLVIGGPAAVVLAGTVTAVIAWRGADPVVSTPAVAQVRDGKALSDAPALQARNHTAAVGQ